MRPQDSAGPDLTCAQVEFLNKLIREICEHPPGNGSITIVIHHGHPAYIVPAPNLDLPQTDVQKD